MRRLILKCVMGAAFSVRRSVAIASRLHYQFIAGGCKYADDAATPSLAIFANKPLHLHRGRQRLIIVANSSWVITMLKTSQKYDA